MSPVLTVSDLTLALPAGSDRSFAASGVSFAAGAGEVVALVGESGSGKTLTALAVAGLLPDEVRAADGSVRLGGREILGLSDRAMCGLRGREIGVVFQEPMTSLNPAMRIADQVAETFRVHRVRPPGGAARRVADLLAEMGLPDPDRIAKAYPHQLSGGQRQRVMIATALALEPRLLVADEPTTALDVTTQKQILALLGDLRRRHGTAILLITHDFGVVAEAADRVVVMRNGQVVENGPAREVLSGPTDPYTRALLAAVPSFDPPPPRALGGAPDVLSVSGLSKRYRSGGFFRRGREVQAVGEVSFAVRRGETLGLVGESGSGKSSVGRCAMRLIEPDAGRIVLVGRPVDRLSQRAYRPLRRHIQMVFQDPFASLNPRRSVLSAIAEGPVALGVPPEEARARAERLLELVGLPPTAASRLPHQFSGGQRQRVCIARALAVEPAVLVADEPVSALDVSVQAQILALLRDLQDRLGLAMLFVTHDLRVAAQICDRVAVMRQGRIVEEGETAALFADPRHPYTRALIESVPGRGGGS